MRETIHRTSPSGGNDFFYCIKCDVCGEPLKTIANKKEKSEVIEFRTCGEETLSALARGWIVEGNTAICEACIHSIGE